MKKEDIISIIKSEMAKVPVNENGMSKTHEDYMRRHELSYLLAEVLLLGMTEEEGRNFAHEEGFDHIEVYDENGDEKDGMMKQMMGGSEARLHIENGVVARVGLSAGRLIAYHMETLIEILKKWQELVKPDELICDGTQWYSAWMRDYASNYKPWKPYTGKATTTIKFEK